MPEWNDVLGRHQIERIYAAGAAEGEQRLWEFCSRLRQARLTGDGREVTLTFGLIEAEMLETALGIGASAIPIVSALRAYLGR